MSNDAPRDDLAAEVQRLRAQVERLRPWAKLGEAIMEDWPEFSLDAFDLQEVAVASGVLLPVPGGFDPAVHADLGYSLEPGDDYFTLVPWAGLWAQT